MTMIKIFNRWEVEMDTSRKGSVYRATWREGKECITHYFGTFTGMVGYLGMIDFYSFKDYFNHLQARFNL